MLISSIFGQSRLYKFFFEFINHFFLFFNQPFDFTQIIDRIHNILFIFISIFNFIPWCSNLHISIQKFITLVFFIMVKDLFYRWQNVSNSTLYPDVLKIKTNCCETKFYKNAICLLFTNFQIHHLATLLPGRPSHRVARYGFINKKMAFLKNFVWQQSLFLFSKHLDTMSNLTHFVSGETDPW